MKDKEKTYNISIIIISTILFIALLFTKTFFYQELLMQTLIFPLCFLVALGFYWRSKNNSYAFPITYGVLSILIKLELVVMGG